MSGDRLKDGKCTAGGANLECAHGSRGQTHLGWCLVLEQLQRPRLAAVEVGHMGRRGRE